MEKNDYIDAIVQIEWVMFHETQNIGGQASCQNKKNTFEIMRKAQFSVWNEKTLVLYYDHIRKAEDEGENILAYKYAYMMKYTDPLSYKEIEDQLPKISGKKEKLVDELIVINKKWSAEFSEKFPNIAENGRKRTHEEEQGMYPSIETYGRGEMYSYDEATLESLLELYREADAEGKNLHEDTVCAEMKLYGFDSLEEVESKMI